jgi:hypothetical protein
MQVEFVVACAAWRVRAWLPRVVLGSTVLQVYR